MDDLTGLLIKQECADLVARYAKAVNDCDTDTFVSLFAEDGTWQRPKAPLMSGHGEIREFIGDQLSRERLLQHVNGTVLIEVEDENNASGWSQTTVYRVVGSRGPLPLTGTVPEMVVEYRDRYQRQGGKWFFTHRNTTVLFIQEGWEPG